MPNRRRIFMVNRPFQLRFAFYVCSFVFALSFAYPLILSNSYDFFLRNMVGDPSAPPIAYIKQARQELLSLVLLMEVVFLTFAFMISLFISHRIAGPIYKLRKFLRDAKEGQFSQKLSFRKNDHFHELADDYNALIKSVQTRFKRQNEVLHALEPILTRCLEHANDKSKNDLKNALKILKESASNQLN